MTRDPEGSELSEALAQGLLRAEVLKREAEGEYSKRDDARRAISLAAEALGGRAIKAIDDKSPLPRPVEFKRLYEYLLRSNDRAKVIEGIERELAWCEGVVTGSGLDLASYAEVALPALDDFRVQLLEFARGLLAPGEELPDGAVPAFAGVFEAQSQVEVQKLAELLDEVRRAYKKYQCVVSDNGPFALYSSGRFDGSQKLDECLEELRQANAKPYDGLFDDDYSVHVDAFWQGFCKLGSVCERCMSIDATPLLSYFIQSGAHLNEAVQTKKLGDFDVFTVLRALRGEE